MLPVTVLSHRAIKRVRHHLTVLPASSSTNPLKYPVCDDDIGWTIVMRTIVQIIAALLAATMLVYAVAAPAHGILYASPGATLGVALIGLGLIMRCREQQTAPVTVEHDAASQKTTSRSSSITGD